ncbi:hypothetical protein NIES4071_50600 [Calothrix sp. NIES-4071]|nr:hypothetical protein NIES4071_50600 [Calothrix sp. NIES-4071]BAZ59367.1 hypothetical protein NIES4105_50540 [Calothrix sp. NIES-4105]
MTSFLCDQAIDFDATNTYEAKDVERLINQIQAYLAETENRKVVVLLRNAHCLTTKAFALLYSYIRESRASSVVFVLVSTDKSKIFPPLLDFVQSDNFSMGAA